MQSVAKQNSIPTNIVFITDTLVCVPNFFTNSMLTRLNMAIIIPKNRFGIINQNNRYYKPIFDQTNDQIIEELPFNSVICMIKSFYQIYNYILQVSQKTHKAV